MAFKTAALEDFKQGVLQAKPVLLEPIEELTVTCEDANTGDVMGDLNKRRARVLGMDSVEGGRQAIHAEIPSAELYGYGKTLRSLTGGSGEFEFKFLRYQQCPSDVQAREIEARKDFAAKAE